MPNGTCWLQADKRSRSGYDRQTGCSIRLKAKEAPPFMCCLRLLCVGKSSGLMVGKHRGDPALARQSREELTSDASRPVYRRYTRAHANIPRRHRQHEYHKVGVDVKRDACAFKRGGVVNQIACDSDLQNLKGLRNRHVVTR